MVINGMRPIHPGEILREEYLSPHKMSAHSPAKALSVTPAHINDIVRERRGITADTALRSSWGESGKRRYPIPGRQVVSRRQRGPAAHDSKPN